MVTIIVTIAIAFALACVVLITSRRIDADQLVQSRREPLMMGVQIICGDCAGEDYQPSRTFLDRSGHCAQCGGSDFLLASVVAANLARVRVEKVTAANNPATPGRVIPFEAPSAGTRARKIAV